MFFDFLWHIWFNLYRASMKAARGAVTIIEMLVVVVKGKQ